MCTCVHMPMHARGKINRVRGDKDRAEGKSKQGELYSCIKLLKN